MYFKASGLGTELILKKRNKNILFSTTWMEIIFS